MIDSMRNRNFVLCVVGIKKVIISHTCDKCVSIESLELIKFTAIYNSGNDLQSNEERKVIKSCNPEGLA